MFIQVSYLLFVLEPIKYPIFKIFIKKINAKSKV